MKRFLCAFMCLMIAVTLFGCKKEDSTRPEDSLLKGYERSGSVPEYDFMSGEEIMPEEYDRYVAGTTSFAFSLLSEVSTANENAVISPLSVSGVLSLLANGASDNTKKEIRNTVAGVNMDLLNTSYHYLSSRLSAFNSTDSKFTLAESLWFNNSFDVKSTFLQSAVDYYSAEVMRTDLSSDGAKNKVNNWISDVTGNKLTETVEEIPEDVLMLIVNAALLVDEWATPYTENQLAEGTFNTSQGEVPAEFMTSTESYINTTYAEGFVKGFKNLPLKFAAIMPAEDTDVDEFLQSFTQSRWQALLDSQQATSFCTASLPMFELTYKSDLATYLQALGIKTAFDVKKADFSQLSNTESPNLSSVIHEAFVQIGPQGAKAGAATVSEIKGNSESSDMPSVKFDKPFVFVIYDNESGVPVFAGVVNNPTK